MDANEISGEDVARLAKNKKSPLGDVKYRFLFIIL